MHFLLGNAKYTVVQHGGSADAKVELGRQEPQNIIGEADVPGD
jgi:hypothetical protein